MKNMARAKVKMRSAAFAGVLAVTNLAGIANGLAEAPKPAPEPQAKPPAAIAHSDPDQGKRAAMRHQELAGRCYLFRRLEISRAEMPGLVGQYLDEISRAMLDAKVQAVGGPLFIYNNLAGGSKDRFQLDVGFMVPNGTAAVGDLQVRTLPSYPCITMLHSGPTHDVVYTEQKLEQLGREAELKLSGEMREYYLYWERPSSPNSLILVAAAISE